MGVSSTTGRAAGPEPAASRPFELLSAGIYLIILAAVVFAYLRALFVLVPYQERILGGLQIVLPKLLPQFSLLNVLILVALLVLGLAFLPQLKKVIEIVPPGVRGVVTTIPMYLLLGNDKRLVVVLVVVAAFGWIFYGPLSRWISPRMLALPSLVGVPLARFWSAILFTALLSQSLLPTLGATAVMLAYHYADRLMEVAFYPVWVWHWSLPRKSYLGMYVVRLIIAGTGPVLFSYSFAWFNWGFDQTVFFYGVLIAGMSYFVGRVPAPAAYEGR